MSITDIVVIVGICTVLAVPVFDFLTWIFISLKFYKVNPLAKERGRVGTYLNVKQYTKDGRMIGQLDISFDEMFGITNNAILQYERDSALRTLAESKKEMEKIKKKMAELEIKK